MSTIEFVHDATAPAQALRAEVAAGTAFELLIGVSTLTRPDRASGRSWVPQLEACSAALRRDVERVGSHSAELWLHLLGLALERPDDAAAAVRETPADELRRHLVGVHVPAWRALVGLEALEATAAGDPSLLDHERYYAGQARAALAVLLPLSPAQTKRRVLAVLERFGEEVLDRRAVAAAVRDAAAKRRFGLPPLELVEAATGGYRYEPESEIDTVVLVPHLAARPWLLLCQHRRTRLVCYPVPERRGLEERALLLGRALADEGRVRMLRRLGAGDATLAELAETAGVSRSTAHHHLSHLRAASLVTMHGNARSYWFTLRRDGLAEARRLLGDLGG
jgi:DNA-binding transcriptional ArsR family regulator